MSVFPKTFKDIQRYKTEKKHSYRRSRKQTMLKKYWNELPVSSDWLSLSVVFVCVCACWRNLTRPHTCTYSTVVWRGWVAHSCANVPSGQKRWHAANVIWRSHPDTQLQLQRDKNWVKEIAGGETKTDSETEKNYTHWPVYRGHLAKTNGVWALQ